ncbi:MAG: hypothetical protein ABIP35_03105 [Ginsengibacter sp.]
MKKTLSQYYRMHVLDFKRVFTKEGHAKIERKLINPKKLNQVLERVFETVHQEL